ncbi:hypothetical protein KUIN1_02940 [Pseudomonas sp. KUIN-1]|nr:hypothetical protein KUIN1_02940 [Pseudomonas sp. KUIN-1]
MLAPHEIPQLVTRITAKKGYEDDDVEVHVSAKRQKSGKNQNGLAFKKGAEEQGEVAEFVQEILEHCLDAGEMNAQPNAPKAIMKVSICVSTLKILATTMVLSLQRP